MALADLYFLVGYGQRMPIHMPQSLRGDDHEAAIACLTKYYSAGKPYVGATFDTWRSPQRADSPNEFTSDDVLSVTFLSVEFPPSATQRILVTEAPRFNDLLAEIPLNLHFWEAGQPDRGSPQWRLEAELRDLYNVDLAKASKLMARKRPYLVPINDSIVRRLQPNGTSFWGELFQSFSDPSFRERLGSVLDGARRMEDANIPAELSLLRVFDVIAWMDGTRTARD